MIQLPIGVDINNLIDDLRIFSWKAADTLLHYSKILKDPICKADILQDVDIKNPVTLADLKVNEIIIKNIKKNYKDINWDILSEENVKMGSDNCDLKSEWLWVLDPLDGTKDFIQGTGNYAMHLGLNYKNKSYIGVVLIPEKNELWISDGQKSWGEKRDGSHIENNPFIDKKKLKEMILVTSKNHRNNTLNNLIERLQFHQVKHMGSIGCKIASIVRGESDIYISLSLPGQSTPKDWDFAAPDAILKAAGGTITNLNNQEISYNKPSFKQGGIIIASKNRKLHKNICMEVKEIVEKYNIFPL